MFEISRVAQAEAVRSVGRASVPALHGLQTQRGQEARATVTLSSNLFASSQTRTLTDLAIALSPPPTALPSQLDREILCARRI